MQKSLLLNIYKMKKKNHNSNPYPNKLAHSIRRRTRSALSGALRKYKYVSHYSSRRESLTHIEKHTPGALFLPQKRKIPGLYVMSPGRSCEGFS